MTANSQPTFEEQIFAGFRELQQALCEAFTSAELDPGRAYPAAKALRINKNLTWKASKILRAETPAEALDHIPGKSGLGLLLDALQTHGATVDAIARTRSAVDLLDRVTKRHSGDKETLELMLEGLSIGEEDTDNLEKSRRLAFLGNSGIWGIQADARLITYVLTPGSAGDGAFDLTFLVGFVQLKRLRADAPWTLAHSRSFGSDGSVRVDKRREPLFPASSELKGAPIIVEHSTPGMSMFVVSEGGGSLRIELPKGPAGEGGANDVYLGYVARNYANLYADQKNHEGRLIHETNCPIRHGQVDVLVHEDLPHIDAFEYQLFRRRDHDDRLVPSADARITLPIHSRPVPLAPGLGALETPCYARYTDLIATVAERLGTTPDRFRSHRIQLDYPPMGTTGLFSFPLLRRPD